MRIFLLETFVAIIALCIPAAAFSGLCKAHHAVHVKILSSVMHLRELRHHNHINMMNSFETESQPASEPIGYKQTNCNSSHRELFDELDFSAYEQAIGDIISKRNVLREFKKNEEDLAIIKTLLLDNKRRLPLWNIDQFLTKTTGDDTIECSENEAQEKYAKLQLHQRRQMYLDQTNLTAVQHRLATTLLSHLADHCAKTSQPKPLYVAWEKILEAGMTPLSRVLSTYLYVLGLDRDRGDAGRDVAAEVAMFHDAIYEPTEKTITLLVKSLVRRGDAAGAEALLDGIADGPLGDLRHRTTSPILKLYCEQGEIARALRLYKRMRTTSRVKMDAETYCGFIASVARCGYFRSDSKPIDGAIDLGYNCPYGSAFLDSLISEMSEDVLDITENMAVLLHNGFTMGVRGSGKDLLQQGDQLELLTTPCAPDALVSGRVNIDEDTGSCPATNTTLRLIVLEDEQRMHVHTTLLQMAKMKSIEYTSRLAAKGRAPRDAAEQAEQASQIIKNFSDWLDTREGKPFTAIIDGPNVAYFGWGRVNLHQLQRMVNELEEQGEHPLVVMPEKYTRKKFYLRAGQLQVLNDMELELLMKLKERDQMYTVPPMCLDDMYWMLASVSNQTMSTNGVNLHVAKNNNESRFPGLRPICITNDRMRDHRLELLDERSFRRWCCSHIVNYNYTGYIDEYWEKDDREITFHAADIFSDEIQCNVSPGGGNTWHFPVSEWNKNDRFCLRMGESSFLQRQA